MTGSLTPLYQRLSRKSAVSAVVGLGILNVVFAAALAGVVSTQLDYQDHSPGCLLNVKGQVCVFTYITAGAIMLFSLLTFLPAAYLYTHKGAPLHSVYLQLGIFSLFWQIVTAITIQIRGGQAADAGFPKQSFRVAAWTFAWLGVAFTFFSSVVVLLDVLREKALAKEKRLLAKKSSLDLGSVEVLHTGTGIGNV